MATVEAIERELQELPSGRIDDGDRFSALQPREDAEEGIYRSDQTRYSADKNIEDDYEESKESDVDLSIVDEARCLGLCYDYRLDDPLAFTCIPTPPEAKAEDLADPPGVESVALSAVLCALNGASIWERWDVDRASAGLIAEVVALGKDDGAPLHLEDMHVGLGDLKVMEPVLYTDHELDMQRLRARNKAKISNAGMELLEADVDEGEGTEWPAECSKLPTAIEIEIVQAKLEVDRHAIEYLRDTAQPERASITDGLDATLESRRHLEPLTPPLLPMSPPFSPERFSGSLQDFERTSEPEDLLAIDAAQVEHDILLADESSEAGVITHDGARGAAKKTNAGFSHIYSGLETPVDCSSSPKRRKILEDVKAEVPLLPLEGPPAKKAKISSSLGEMQHLIPSQGSDVSMLDADVTNHRLAGFMNDVVLPNGEPAMRKTQSEQLVEIDTTMRAAVPEIDDAELVPPWKAYGLSELKNGTTLMSFVNVDLLKEDTTWAGVSKLERLLPWSPFRRRLGEVTLEEDLDDDKSSERYMADLVYRGDVEIQDYVSQLEQLRLLDDEDSDDDEIEACGWEEKADEETDHVSQREAAYRHQHVGLDVGMVQPEGQPSLLPLPKSPPRPERLDMRSLLLRRKAELEHDSSTLAQSVALGPEIESQQSVAKPCKADMVDATFRPSRPADLLREGGIASFLQLQGAGTKSPKRGTPSLPSTAARLTAAPTAIMVPPPVESQQDTQKQLVMPRPTVIDGKGPMQVVVSAQLLANRSLVRELHSLLPGLEMIELCPLPQKPTGQVNAAAPMAEADVTISAMTGLLATTLQKLKQKPLPGQRDFYGIRERVEAVSQRYERLIVLVSEGRQAQALDVRDTEAISQFMAFGARLDTEVEIHYVPGEEQEMCGWIAAAISSRHVAGQAKLLPEETLWERFLRVAGLNAFAAQLVLATLKKPDGDLHQAQSPATSQGSRAQLIGLPAFIAMPVEERVQRFGPTLGGETALLRASAAIDSGWSIAGHEPSVRRSLSK